MSVPPRPRRTTPQRPPSSAAGARADVGPIPGRRVEPAYEATPSVMRSALERAQDRVGTTLLGKWTLDAVLGIGGMAVVYAATHRNNSRVAIKMLHPEVSLDPEVTARFLREGYVANTVGHPGAVQVFDDDTTDDGSAFLVMELLEGETLEGRWERKGQRLPATEVLPIVDQLLDVLVAAHGRGVVHRDLKPENLFLTRDGRLKVLDFGIARLRELSHSGGATTQVGSLLGTPAFMAPEQALGRLEEVDSRTDLWAVGATLFTLLTGRYVHEADTVNEQLVFAATISAPSLAQFLPALPAPVVRLVDRALAFKKVDRWADASAMQGGLREAQEALELGPLSLPRPSVHGGAPPTLVGAVPFTVRVPDDITDSAAGVTVEAPSEPERVSEPPRLSAPATPRRRVMVGALLGGLVVTALLVMAFASKPGKGAEGSPPAQVMGASSGGLVPTALREPELPVEPSPAGKEPQGAEPAADAGVVAAASAAASAAAPRAKPAPHKAPAPTPKPVALPTPVPTPKPSPAPQPVGTQPPSPGPAPTTNPFDRRH